jgi:hypothetical protein
VTNKVLETILTKTIQLRQKDLAEILPKALWAYRTTHHNTIGFTPYEIVYGKQVILPIEFEVKNLHIALQANMDLTESQQHHLNQINELDELHQASIQQTNLIQ